MRLRPINDTRIVQLTTQDFTQVMLAYAHNCRYFEYYQKMFGTNNCEGHILEHFSEDIKIVLEYGECYGLYKSNQLVSVCFAFDPHMLEARECGRFYNILGDNQTVAKALKEVFDSNKPCYYILGLFTCESNRCQGYATKLLTHTTRILSKLAPVVTDAIYVNAVNMWMSCGFYMLDHAPIRIMKKDKDIL